MKATIFYSIIFASLALVGCTKVDLCEEGTHPHVVEGFSLLYDWDNLDLAKEDVPEKLYFVATRILNTRHIVHQTNEKGEFLNEPGNDEPKNEDHKTDEPEPTPDGSDSETSGDNVVTRENTETETPGEEPTPTPTPDEEEKKQPDIDIQLPGGEYFMMAFTDPKYRKDEDGNVIKDENNKPKEDTRVELINIDEFKENTAMRVTEVKMRHAPLKSVTDIVQDTWQDLNPGIGYVWDAGRKLIISRWDYIELNAGSNYEQLFKFTSLTQHIDITFYLDLVEDEDGVQVQPENIQYIYGEMAGVVPEVSLSTGILNTSSLKRVMMKIPVPTEGETITQEDGRKCTILKCTASMEVFGLVGGMDNYAIVGPGVFCFALLVKTPLREFTSRGIANLSRKIKEIGLTEETGQINERKKVKDRGTLAIDLHLRITPSGTASAQGGEGVIGWEDIKNEIHVDI